MCLVNQRRAVNRLRRRKNQKIVAYKVLQWGTTSSTRRFLYSIFNMFKWNQGWNYARGLERLPEKIGTGTRIYPGIHVYIYKPDIVNKSAGECVLPVVCHVRDLIGAECNSKGQLAVAVFKKVFVKADDYREAVERRPNVSYYL